jgi:hypothetical protein
MPAEVLAGANKLDATVVACIRYSKSATTNRGAVGVMMRASWSTGG